MDPTWLRNGARLRQHHLANEDGLSHFFVKKTYLPLPSVENMNQTIFI